MPNLSAEEARVLGCLIEKQMTTPEYYPMTVNALVAAASQKTNREPVSTYDEELVEGALAKLNDKGLARFTRCPGARALKYVHKGDDVLQVDSRQLALLAVLLLRGPQTPGELRQRTDRYCEFPSVEAVADTLEDLITRDDPLVARLERAPGQKENRYRTVLVSWDGSWTAPQPSPSQADTTQLLERIALLEERMARLEAELGL